MTKIVMKMMAMVLLSVIAVATTMVVAGAENRWKKKVGI